MFNQCQTVKVLKIDIFSGNKPENNKERVVRGVSFSKDLIHFFSIQTTHRNKKIRKK